MSISSSVVRNINNIVEMGLGYVTYFFFDFKDTRKQDARALLSSFLVQLSDQSDSHSDKLLVLYSSHRRGSELPKPTNDALMRCLLGMLTEPGQVPVYLIIDALDECPNDSGIPSSRGKVLEIVKALVELHLPNLRLFITSRPENDIRAVFGPLTNTSISLYNEHGQKRDIVEYITHVVYSEINMTRWREDDKTLVITTLSDRAGGM